MKIEKALNIPLTVTLTIEEWGWPHANRRNSSYNFFFGGTHAKTIVNNDFDKCSGRGLPQRSSNPSHRTTR